MHDLLMRRGYWRRCQHHSRRRTCLRGQSYDYFCPPHNRTCWDGDCHLPHRKS